MKTIMLDSTYDRFLGPISSINLMQIRIVKVEEELRSISLVENKVLPTPILFARGPTSPRLLGSQYYISHGSRRRRISENSSHSLS